jgi:hypothetical protein
VNYWVRSTAGMTLQGETYNTWMSSLTHFHTACHKYYKEWPLIEDGPPRDSPKQQLFYSFFTQGRMTVRL